MVEDDPVTQAADAPQTHSPQSAYTQPAQPVQYAVPNPVPQPPVEKKSRKGLIIGIIAGAVIIAAIVVLLVFFVFNKKDDGNSSGSAQSTSTEGKTEAATEAETEEDTEEETEKETVKNSQGNRSGVEDFFWGEDNIKLTVWVSDSAVASTKTLCEQFKEENPQKTIDIDIQVMSEGEASATLLNDPYAGADVFSFAGDQLRKLCDANAISRAAFPDEITAHNTEASVTAATIDDTIYAYPMTGDNGYYLVYDKSIVTDKDAETMEGILEACRKAGKKMIIDSSNGFYSCMFPFTGGLKLEGTVDYVQQFNDYDADEVTDSLCAFAKLYSEYSDVLETKEVVAIGNGFRDGTVAAGIDGNWNASANMNALGDNFGAVKLPTINVNGENRQIVSLSGYKLMGVNANSKYPNAAQLLADYLTNENAQSMRVKELSWGPTNKMVMTTDEVLNSPALMAVMAQSEYSVSMADIADTFWTPMGSLGKYVANGNTDRDAMKKELEKTLANIRDE